MTITPLPLIDLQAVGPDWPDEVADLSDRRRLLLRIVFGADVSAEAADAVFQAPYSSTAVGPAIHGADGEVDGDGL